MAALLALALYCAACATKSMGGLVPTSPAPSAESGTPSASAPTSTATSASSPTVPPAPVYFTEAFDSKPAHWVFIQADNGLAFSGPSVREGFLVFDMPVGNEWGYALYGGRDYTDVLAETEVQSRTSGDGAAGLVCRYDEKKGWYEFNIFAEGTYQLLFGQWLAQGVARYTPLYQGKSQAIRSDVNKIGLQCQGNMLAPSINGSPLRKWPELKFGLQHGEIGLSASSFVDAPFTIAFDWARVSAP